jgi:Transcriptional regulator containing an amidase domain and an AraC-type DNA-binding HTH domain
MFITDLSLFCEFLLILFSLVLLFKESGLKKANRTLAIVFINMALCNFSMLWLHYSSTHHYYSLLSYYVPCYVIFGMLISPSIYFYIRTLFGHSSLSVKKLILPHALPVLLAVIYLLVFCMLPVSRRINILLDNDLSFHWIVISINILFYVQCGIYSILGLTKVSKMHKSDYILLSGNRKMNVRWLRTLFCTILSGLFIYILLCCIYRFDHIRIVAGLSIINVVILFTFIESVWNTGLSMQHSTEAPANIESRLKIKDQQLEIYLDKVQEIMETTPIYLSPTCTINDLAKSSNIPPHHLSKVINSHEKMNFNDFINKYRVEHACNLLVSKQKQNLTLEAISIECGFGSRSNFNRAFKKHTGKTPTKYQSDLF